ncbi:group 1 truncated hemoglobin [Terasakiella sp. A23]|uniref:group I truncated hemoglobin n=1 Tax=Terasakiella sp. FCG-A23 TaxID=3080561 RepID=UPI00295547CC|nr:group 1 truncated hemoglobin [Terasakiella sp. A23]MDV7339829.1 group 1 truncated hemoglobin [Terasakiella sp. A23]
MLKLKKMVVMLSFVAAALIFTQSPSLANSDSLYNRLGGYDAVSAVIDDLMERLISDKQLGRFWANRGDDGVMREKQLVKSFIASKAGGPLFYLGRENKQSHRGMKISDEDWKIFMGHLEATLVKFALPPREKNDVVSFIESTRKDIVNVK